MKIVQNMLMACLVLVSHPLYSKTESKDPFRKMSLHTLSNGMKVVMGPSENSKNVSLKVVVGFGRWGESFDNLQAGHVLEHMLFKDGGLADNKSYLEIIKEAGGDVNAYVNNQHTAYYTTIPAERSGWLIDNFKSMLFDRKLEEKELELGKASVELEIGKPFIVNRWFGSNPLGVFLSSYFPIKNFSETEFGVNPHPYSREDERLSVRRLKLDDIKNVYNEYYHPENMTIFLTGKFNPIKMLATLEQKYGNIKLETKKFMPKKYAQTMGEDFQEKKSSTGDSSRLTYGLKLFKRTAKDVLVVDAYMEYVAHRLMIELRNKKGETYTAYSSTFYENDGGYSYVSFQTPQDKYETNKKMLTNLIQKEARDGSFSDEDVQKAIDLHLKTRYELKDNDASGLMKFAESFFEFKDYFKENKTPYQLLAGVKPSEFKEILKSNFTDQRKYSFERVSPLLFKYDLVLLFFLTITGSIFFFKTVWGNKSDEESIAWSVKTSSTPGLVPEVLTMLIGAFVISYLVQRPFEYFYENTNLYRNSIILREYLSLSVSMFVFVGIFMRILSNYPTKVSFTGKYLLVRDLILKDNRIELESIASIKVVSPLTKYSLRYLKSRYGLMTISFDFFPWRSSLLISLKDGTSFIVNVKEAEKLKLRIEELHVKEELREDFDEAA